jgi:DNA-directed RNA polymerase specialized sigma24 family protein
MKSGEDAGSVTVWIGDIKEAGDAAAQQQLINRYWEKLAILARRYLRTKFPQGGIHDENDALNNAFDTLFRRARDNRFPDLGNRDDLWRLLVVITKRKVQKGIREDASQKNVGGKVVHLGGATSDGEGRGGLDQIEGARLVRGGVSVEVEPSADDAICAVEEFNRLLNKLGDDTLRVIALLRMEGLTDDEIGVRFDRTRRWVQRKISLIKEAWITEIN